MKKHQTTLSDELERKIIRLFALGMSYQDISREIEDLYAFSVSTTTISAVTDKVIPELNSGSSARWKRFIPSSGWTPFTIKSAKMGVIRARQFIPYWR